MNEIEKFAEDFKEKLADSARLYQESERLKQEELNDKERIPNIRKSENKGIKKSLSSLNNLPSYKRRVVSKNYFARLNTEEHNQVPSSVNIFEKSPPWIPNNFFCDYFEEFQRLKNKHILSTWEYVSNNSILITLPYF